MNTHFTHSFEQQRERIIQDCIDMTKRVTVYAFQILRNIEEARDAVQASLGKICHVRSFSKGCLANTEAWFFNIVRNTAWDMIRRRKTQERYEEEILYNSQLDQTAVGPIFLDAEWLWSIIEETLSKRKVHIVRRVCLEGRSYAEVAEEMNLTVNNVGFLLHAAKARLRKKLREFLFHINRIENAFEFSLY